ncbi:MAG: hypothetical protein AAFO07_27150 [Bacteroidota bacterium]
MKKSLLLQLIAFILPLGLYAQLDLNDFRLGGSARKLNEQCIRLVPDVQYVSGSAWYKKPIDLNNPFELEVCLVFGDKDLDGADGIVFAFYPQMARTGYAGEGMGFAGLIPSLGIEFDTYKNYHLNDPDDDHLAVMVNGQTYHSQYSFQPVLLPNLEDANRHVMRFLWDPAQQVLDVYVDNERAAIFEGDVINQIFLGNPIVYWGVTAATGRLSNTHEICIKKMLFTDATETYENFEEMNKAKMISKVLGEVQFKAGTNEVMNESMVDLESVLAFLNNNESKKLSISGAVDLVNASEAVQKLYQQRVNALVNYFIEHEIAPDRIRISVKSIETDPLFYEIESTNKFSFSSFQAEE